ncbi:MAG: LemA family protein [Planctomycetaceae bacterium]|nr:LemA family protein [Planctomycetaceae bacterium]
MTGLIVIGGIFLFAVLVIAGMYNSLVGKRNQVHNILGTMDAMLKKRWDLVPNLVATVKGYADHERQLFEKVTEARARAQSGGFITHP